jgi:hypothetical protein
LVSARALALTALVPACAIANVTLAARIDLPGGDRYEPVQTVETSPGARTDLLVPALKELFVAAPAARGRSAAVPVYRIACRPPQQ